MTDKKRETFGNFIYMLLSMLVFVVMIIAGFKYSQFLYTESSNSTLNLIVSFAMIIAWLIIYWLQIIIHESGHLIFGLLSGYSFSSFRIGSLFISKSNGKIKLSKLKLAGTGGQCLLAPPTESDKPTNPILYLLGGGILNAITALITLPFIFIVNNVHVKYSLFMFFFFGIITALLNLIPANLKYICNDGYNVLILSKRNEKSVEALNFQLNVSNALTKGISIKDMPDEWFIFPEKQDLTDFLITTKAYVCITREIEKGNFEWVYGVIDGLLSLNVPLLGIYQVLLKGELLYLGMILNKLTLEQANDINNSLSKDYKALKNNISMLRVNYSAELLLNKNQTEASKILAVFNKLAKVHPYVSESITENKLITLANDIYAGSDILNATSRFVNE
ncbi:MAG: hypothetical protein IKJ19_01850 [Clostridia bacterium]|nr:hypothetical protein [Clostridia bacterium]